MAHSIAGGSQPRKAGRHPSEPTTFEQIRDKERELTELIAAAHREAVRLVASAREQAEYLVASAAAEARSGAAEFLRLGLAGADREAENIVARAGQEVDAVRRTAEERVAAAVDLICRCVIPASSGEEER